MQSSIKKNISYNIIYQILVMILPFITAPYLSRVVGKEGIGIYTYVNSITYYFVIFAALGLANYGNRTIAQNRDDKNRLNKTFSEIYTIQLMISMIVFVVYLGYCFFYVKEYKLFFLIQIFHVASVFFDVSWFFYGMEEFKKLVTINTVIKFLVAISIFVIVKSPTDIWKYTFVMSFSIFLSQFILWTKLRKYVHYKRPTFHEALKHLKPILILFIPVIAVSLYRVMDKIMIGKLSTMEQTGLYENSDKLVTIPLTIISAIGTVMMPKMANLYIKGKIEQTVTYIRDSMQLVLGLSVAMMFGMAAIAEEFAPIFYGVEFIDTGKLIVALTPILIFDSIANVIRTQYLIPKQKDKIYIISVVLGAILNLLINYVCIPKWGAMGAVYGTLAAEFTVMVVQCIGVKSELEFGRYFKDSVPFFVAGIIMYISLSYLEGILKADLFSVFLQIVVGGIEYVAIAIFLLYFFQKERYKHIISLIKNK